MKELISTMEAETRENGERRFTPKTIVNYYLIAAAVFATAKDRRGKQLFPRQWDFNYIGLPAVDKKTQKTPTLEAIEIETILAAAKKLYRVLYCLLAGSGLRISEGLGLEIGKHFSADCSIVYVRQQRSKKGHKIESYPKTDAGIRDRRKSRGVGAKGFEPSTSWSRTRNKKHLSRCPGASYGFSDRSLLDKFGQASTMVRKGGSQIFRGGLFWFDDP